MGVKWEKILEEMQQIANAHGGALRPEDVVEFAQNPETALYDCFTWDDKEAARQWRLWEKASEDAQKFLHKYEGLEELAEVCAEMRKVVLGQVLDD
jgi:hypothetical protein